MLVPVGPEELGRQLRRARQHLGLSLRDVHAVTAIPLQGQWGEHLGAAAIFWEET